MRVTSLVKGSVLVLTISMLMSACLDHEIKDTGVQLAQDIQTIDQYILENSLNAVYDPSGIRFVIHELGKKGVPPRSDQTIKVKYTGKFLDGTVWDDGKDDATGTLSSFIGGWQYFFSYAPVGTKATLFVPSPLGFGAKGTNNVPANSILVFEVDFTEITLSNAEKARFTADTTDIDAFLEQNSITAVTDTTGIRYVVTEEGGGAIPNLFSKVKISYVGKSFTSGNEFARGTAEPGSGFDSRPCDFIGGLKVALQKMPQGSKLRIYIPSGLAFGPFEGSSINLPANSIVVYEVEMIDIVDI